MDLVFLFIMDQLIKLESWDHFGYSRSTYLCAKTPSINLIRKTELQESKATKLNKILCLSTVFNMNSSSPTASESQLFAHFQVPSRYNLQYIACIWTTRLNQKCKNKHKLKLKIAAKMTIASYRAVSS